MIGFVIGRKEAVFKTPTAIKSVTETKEDQGQLTDSIAEHSQVSSKGPDKTKMV